MKPTPADLIKQYTASIDRYEAQGDAERVRIMKALIADLEKRL